MTHAEICPVGDLRWAVYADWSASEGGDAAKRHILSNLLRVLVLIATGRGSETSLAELRQAALAWAAYGEESGRRLGESLRAQEAIWRDHIESGVCAAGVCGREPLAPCQDTCPAGIDIPGFMAQIGRQEQTASTMTIMQDNPLPFVCGLICPAPCESACLRADAGGAVNIRAMKAVATRHALASGAYPQPAQAEPSGKSVGIVGSGPAGLSAAYFLALFGHAVTVYEEAEEAGGMLRYGIPAYRLPTEVVRQEIAHIRSLGVDIRTGTRVDHIDELKRAHDAVFVAAGLQRSRGIPLEGIDQPFVGQGIDFLKAVRAGKNPRVGPHVVVIGGGNVAMDVALTARRQGGQRVEVYCLESRAEMPASPHEQHEALEEGIIFNNGWGPLRVTADHTIAFQRCLRVFDENRRFAPLFDPDDVRTVPANTVLLAVGQMADLAMVEHTAVVLQRGLVVADPVTLQTGDPQVFAGGDVVRGPRIVVEAVADGKRAALSINDYLQNRTFDPAQAARRRRTDVTPLPTSAAPRTASCRSRIPMVPVEERGETFMHIEIGLCDTMARQEAERCLRCDLCAGCGLCEIACASVGVNAIRMERTGAGRLVFHDFERPAALCIGCGACAQACPEGAIRMEDRDGIRTITITGTPVSHNRLVQCPECGVEYATEAFRAHLSTRQLPSLRNHADSMLCPACARNAAARLRAVGG
jgi:NADPH-dependent glutamate synthase beta subunit-like oxidoreductase/ferredoxin